MSPEGRNRIRDPIRASQLARCFSLRARAPRQFVSTPLGRPVGAMILTACSPNGNHSVDNPSESQDEWRKHVWMAPPCFCVGHPALGNGRTRFPRCPKTQTSGRHPIPTKNPWLRSRIHVELRWPNCRTLGATHSTAHADSPIPRSRLLRRHNSFAWQIARMCSRSGMPV